MGIVVSTGPKPPPVSPIDQRKKRRQARVLLEGGIILVILCFGLLLRVLAFEGVLVTSGSMEPTLRKGDYTLVDHRVAIRSTWTRGDVIIFDSPENWQGSDSTFVKRLIGLPGETVTIFEGRTLINGQPISEPYLKDMPDPSIEGPFKLGPDEYFVMGDNRNNSDDSRDNGPIKEKYIRGRVLSRLWPRDRFGSLEHPVYDGANPDGDTGRLNASNPAPRQNG